LTAIVPLVGLTAAFHYFRWLPSYFAEGQWMQESVKKLGRYARRKGWIGDEERREVELGVREGRVQGNEENGEGMARWLIEGATAYAVVKVLVPVRLVLSAFWAPWFARRLVLPVGGGVRVVGAAIAGVLRLR
jgi:hypothetical protein